GARPPPPTAPRPAGDCRRVMTRFSKAKGTRSSVTLVRAAAINFLSSSARFMAVSLSSTILGACWLQVFVPRDALEASPHFGPGAEGADFHERDGPTG